jgi:hypothetical protein
MKYCPLKPGETYQVVIMDSKQDKNNDVYLLPAKRIIPKGCLCHSHYRDTGEHVDACPICESEKIKSRFEILDL